MSTSLEARLAKLRGSAAPCGMDARALAALAANPGCRRRALLDAAGVDKRALASRLGQPAPFGQSKFAIARGTSFEARVKADGHAELRKLLGDRLGLAAPGDLVAAELTAAGPAGRAERTRQALADAAAAGQWALLDHPLLCLAVAGSTVRLEPDAVVASPDGQWTVIEIKSFPILDGSADPEKVGAAARQAAVYVLALHELAVELGHGAPQHTVLLVCPRNFSNLPTAAAVDVRKQLAATRRQLARLTHIEEIVAELPLGTTFDLRLADDGKTPTRPPEDLAKAVAAVPATYAPECLAACELAFHCRKRARELGSVAMLGREVRGELGALRTVDEVLAAAYPEPPGTAEATAAGPDSGPGYDPAAAVDSDLDSDPAVWQLRRAALLRTEALREAAACR